LTLLFKNYIHQLYWLTQPIVQIVTLHVFLWEQARASEQMSGPIPSNIGRNSEWASWMKHGSVLPPYLPIVMC